MKALVYNSYGSVDVLSVHEVPTPTPGPDQVVVKVAAASVNKGDTIVSSGSPFAVRLATGCVMRPKPNTIIGSDFAGIVSAVGDNVKTFAVGDEVYGQIDFTRHGGAMAEYVCLGATDAIAIKPRNLSFVQAAAMPVAAQTAFQALRDDGKLQSGSNVLVNGGSGGVGSFAIQLAKALGAAHVTAVCSSSHADAACSHGADCVVDYEKEDFTTTQNDVDVVIDLVGNQGLRKCCKVLKGDGTYVTAGGSPETFLGRLFRLLTLRPFVSQRLVVSMLTPSQALLQTLAELAEENKVVPYVCKEFKWEQSTDAFKFFSQGHVSGKVVVTFS
ncbi:unnamed protein product [Aphanomyces euteiches]